MEQMGSTRRESRCTKGVWDSGVWGYPRDYMGLWANQRIRWEGCRRLGGGYQKCRSTLDELGLFLLHCQHNPHFLDEGCRSLGVPKGIDGFY